jgi:TonB family protein
MRNFISFICLLLPLWVTAQPSCPTVDLIGTCWGKVTLASGEPYVGEMIDGLPEGRGALFYLDGTRFVGMHKQGLPSGFGIEYSKYGVVSRSGWWNEGKLQSPRELRIDDYPFTTFLQRSSTALVVQNISPQINSRNCEKPEYPSLSRRLIEEGSVNLRFLVNETGRVIDSEVVESSGFERLDKAAINGLSKCIFKAGMKDGKPFTSWATMRYTWKIDVDPVCIGNDISKWNSCLGSVSENDGRLIVAEYQNSIKHGRGIEYDKIGNVIKSGIYEKDVFKVNRKLDQSLFPFKNISSIAVISTLSINEENKSTVLAENLSILKEKRIALVIGNSKYGVRPLQNPINDANDISRELKNSGFNVIDLRDATLHQMRVGVRQFGDQLLNNEVGLVYYSGHGVEVKGRNYFIPVNADIQREDEITDQGLDVSLVLEKMSTAGKGVNILIVDACRDDPFGRSFRSSSRGLATMDAPRGTIIAYATSPGKVASDGDGRNSPYTKNLVRAMQQPNKPIEQVFKEVRRAVQAETKNQQTPWENTSLSGDFYFKKQ